MYANEPNIRAIVEAIDGPSEISHTLAARITYACQRASGHGPDVAGWQVAKAMHDVLSRDQRADDRLRSMSGGIASGAVSDSAYCRRVIALRDLRYLIDLWAPIGVPA
jgi:hypothetical protein